MVFKDLKEHQKALDCFKKALALYEAYFGKEGNLNGAFCMNNLGMLYK